MKHLSGIVLIIFSMLAGIFLNASAQSTSNKGTDFWLAYGNHVAGYTPVIGQEMVVYITSDVSTSGVLEVGGTSIPFQVSANAITNVTVPQMAYIGNVESKISDKGIHITSLLPIVVYAHIYDQAVSGATLVLPTNTLGKDYFSLNYEQISNSLNSHSFFFVVATEDNTEIIITPSVNTQGGLKAGVASAPIKLNKGEIYQVFGVETSRIGSTTKGGDLTGSRIQSISTTSEPCKKIAVFAGSGKMAIGCLNANGSAGSADNLFQQVYPTASWGKSFITVPSKDRNYDVYRIFKSDPNAVVKLNGTIIPTASFVNNFYYEFAGQTVNYVESDKAIQVALYAVTQGKSMNCTNVPGDVGDPEMIFLNPLEQTLSQITMYSTQLHMITKHFINIVIPKTAVSSFTLDGTSQASLFQTVAAHPEYSYAQIPVSSGTHNLQANAGFNAIAYGFGNAESYGYAAGTNIKGLGVEIRKSNNNKLVSSVCVNEQLILSVKLNSLTSKIVWDLGNGSTPTEILNPVPVNSTPTDGLYEFIFPQKVIYNALQNYKIKVTADKTSTDGCGSSEVIELQFSAINPPSAVMTALKSSCVNVPTAFRDTSSANGNKIIKWLWDFGDGGLSDLQHPVHTFLKSGVYTVKLLVEGESGCESNILSQDIIVYALPVADFTAGSPACENKTLIFNDQSVSSQGKIIKWFWDFGDQSPVEEKDSAVPFTHTFKSSGTYIIKLKVLTENGCESVAFEKSILINPSPLVNFGVPEVCIKDSFAQFTDSTTISDGTELTYLWNFGNASAAPGTNTSTLKNPTHRYTLAGNYQVTLTVTSKAGCVTTVVKTFTVNGATPTAGFEVLNSAGLCSNKEVVFRNTSTVDFGEVGKIEWYFDYDNSPTIKMVDENPFPNKEYRFTYPVFSSQATKQVRVRMVAFSGGSCFDENRQLITLMAVPSVSFTSLAKVCQEVAPFRITQASELSGQTGIGTFSGPGLSSTGIFNPAQAGVGTHTLQYVFSANNGCSESISQTITVMPTPSVNAGRDTLILEGGETKLNAIASGSNLTYKWFPSTGLSRDDIPDPVASPTEDIIYTLTVTSDQACAAMDNIRIKVLKQPEVPNAFSPNNDGMNDLWNVKYLESYANATVKVFSRYGGVVYQSSKGYAKPWNGQFNGLDLPVGTYYYIIDPKTKGRQVISGAVTILR